MGQVDSSICQDTICRWNGINIHWYGMGLWKKQAVGNRPFIWLSTTLFYKKSKITFTLKQNFIPWSKRLNKNFSLEPLATGLYVNTIFDGEFWVNEPDKYPNGYYSFSTKMRFNIYIGQRITFHIPSEKRFFTKSITAFYEISSNDLYIASAFTNSYLKPTDYLRLSFGLKMQLF